jgi:uncharacterized membrane protein
MVPRLDDWFLWTIASTLCFGVQYFLFKRLTEKKGDLEAAQVVMSAVVCVAALLFIGTESHDWANSFWTIALIAMIQGGLYFFTTLYRLDALENGIATNILFPILRASTPIVVVLSALFLNEWESFKFKSPTRSFGIVLSIVATYVLIRWPSQKQQWSVGVLVSAIAAVVASAGASLMAKAAHLAVDNLNVFVFILISNTFSLLISIIKMIHGKQVVSRKCYHDGLFGGFLIGLLSFSGITCFMLALKGGELSAVAAINSVYILIPIILAALLYGEKMTVKTGVAVFLTILAVALLSS